MKINKTEVFVETGGGKEEEVFAIGNLGFILKLLREKMYSEPIKAIAREISCNARDANREVGKGDVPIKIQLRAL
jgi:hypothetical protein